jgi:hypothetical protein
MVVFQTKNVINKKVYSCPIGQKWWSWVIQVNWIASMTIW